MKHYLITVLIAGSASISVFAQTPAPAQPANNGAQIAQTGSPAQNGEWTSPQDQPAMEKTRTQVRQELMLAERDGQLATLNSTVFAHQ
ncbi:hypothetical protein A6V36_35215 [Paraburkholderia ginsengiterrae]|uniref:DUF4148 domain-containing protein n=1 Tax=Paraburkholderia ginsengiterrae TaxID=1462993 RepID=A0A1A9N8V4_9BURK|nr:DUF4148 domain-containing protein [Paraburkholderia ginsengiterrae]OAJ55365.1 hypothetical protein A6V36_35215 [Paraburkholderia ginsengiterrae]OAJ61376.1 hypothetical protein A6V37_25550 [Paraburkholderia ginsengiterrae]